MMNLFSKRIIILVISIGRRKNVSKFADCNNNMTKNRMKKIIIYLFLTFLSVTCWTACNSNDVDREPTVLSQSVRVSSFSLAKNDSIMLFLDSVAFSINPDVNPGLIYNADSLPVGTRVDSLIANISFESVSSAWVYMTDPATGKQDSINYLYHPTDSINFTDQVQLKLTAEDGVTTKWYEIKVNVHQLVPDSLQWTLLQTTVLPGDPAQPVAAQRTVKYRGAAYCYLLRGETYYLSVAEEMSRPDTWTLTELNFGFVPRLESLQSSADKLYLLSDAGQLYESSDGSAWTAVEGETFHSLKGVWENMLLGVRYADGKYTYGYYPNPGIAETEVDETFPITGSTDALPFTTKWSDLPQSILVGGRDRNDRLTGMTWGFDGKSWASLGIITPPAREGAVLFPYFSYSTNTHWVVTEYTCWFLVGGKNAEGVVSNEVYTSLNNGITWTLSTDLTNLPEDIPGRAFASSVLMDETFTPRTQVSSAWRKLDTPRIPYGMRRATGKDYNVPYIYIFGGEDAQGAVYDQILRGVINRLTFVPIP